MIQTKVFALTPAIDMCHGRGDHQPKSDRVIVIFEMLLLLMMVITDRVIVLFEMSLLLTMVITFKIKVIGVMVRSTMINDISNNYHNKNNSNNSCRNIHDNNKHNRHIR